MAISKNAPVDVLPGACRVKGLAVRAGLRWVAETYGLSTVQTVYDAGSPALRAAIVPGLAAFGILSTGWYEVSVIGELLDLISRVTQPPKPLTQMRLIAEAVAVDNVSGAYRSLFRLIATRPLLVAHAQRVWNNYFDAGTIDVTSAREGELFFRIRGGEHNPSVCLITSLVLERILLEVGYKSAILERKRCMSTGATDCAFEVDYLS